MPDDPNGRVITFPGSGNTQGGLPPIPRYADTVREQEAEDVPAFPTVPDFPDPATFLRSEGIPTQAENAEPEEAEYDEGGGYEDSGEYRERRSLTEVIADWIQFRVDSARETRDEHAPFRNAQVADKVTRLTAQTERQMSLATQHNELQKAHVDARKAMVSAQGKSAAIGSGSDSGKGLGKGAQRGPGGSGGPGGGGGSTSRPPGGGSGGGPSSRAPGGGRDTNRQNGGSQRNGDLGRNPDGPRRGPGGSSGGSNWFGRSSNPPGGGNGRQSGSGGGRGGGGGSTGGQSSSAPVSSQAERTRARQARRSRRQEADLADRTADRSQARQNRQRNIDDSRERVNARRDKKEAERQARRAAGGDGGTPRTLAGLVAGELKRRRDHAEGRGGGDQAAVKPADASAKPDGPQVKADDAAVKADDPSLKVDDPSLKVDLTKGPTEKDGAEGGTPPAPSPEAAATAAPQDKAPADEAPAPGEATGNGWVGFLRGVYDKDDHPPGDGPGGPDPETVFAGNPDKAPRGAAAADEDDIPDAEIVEEDEEADDKAGPGPADPAMPAPDLDPVAEAANVDDLSDGAGQAPPGRGSSGTEEVLADMAGQVAQTAAGADDHIAPDEGVVDAEIVVDTGSNDLPSPSVAAPAAEEPVTPMTVRRRRRHGVTQRGIAREHRTNITFDEFLTAMANIAVNSAEDARMVKDAVEHLIKLAAELRVMSADLGGSHNIDRKVTNLLADLADYAAVTAQQSKVLAQASERAANVAMNTALSVAAVYSEDLEAMDEGGVEEASAAVHHN
ncbi:hypothetical protein ACFW1A_00745 [Kitasatospora sp. NPDC058965]|uniref:hypothetical protein n=1 Tax=Kitasatospora sp. NPDC058965 TaxID=3346682 RepID=UPI00367AF744